MCIGICAVATQRGERRLWFRSGINSHHDLRKSFGIRDDKHQEQVNLEAHPTGHLTDDPWIVKVDHDMGNIPQWYVDDQMAIEGLFMDFVESEIKAIRETKIYNGSLDLRGCTGLTSVDGLTAKEWIDLRGCTGLTSVDGLTADRIDLSGCTGLTSVDGLTAKEWIDLSGCTQIPKENVPLDLISKCFF